MLKLWGASAVSSLSLGAGWSLDAPHLPSDSSLCFCLSRGW